MYSSSLWRIDTIVFATLKNPPPLPQGLNRGLKVYDPTLSAKNGIVNHRHTTKPPFPSFLCTLISSSPLPPPFKTCRAGSIYCWLATMVRHQYSSVYHQPIMLRHLVITSFTSSRQKKQ